MKRSEMINVIDYLISTSEDYPSATEILELIEDKGMLPPFYNENEGSGNYGIPSSFVNEWETE